MNGLVDKWVKEKNVSSPPFLVHSSFRVSFLRDELLNTTIMARATSEKDFDTEKELGSLAAESTAQNLRVWPTPTGCGI